jgi:hypothetical protein
MSLVAGYLLAQALNETEQPAAPASYNTQVGENTLNLRCGSTFTLHGKKHAGVVYEVLNVQVHGVNYGVRQANGKVKNPAHLSFQDLAKRATVVQV